MDFLEMHPDELYILADTIPQLVWVARPDGNVEYYNQRWRDYTGLTLEQAQGDGWLQSLHPDDRQGALEAWQNAIQTDVEYEVEKRMLNSATGTYRWFLVRGSPCKNAEGTIVKWVGICTDIDDRKQMEQTLKASEEQLRVLAESVPHLVWSTRPDGYVEYWNQRFADYCQATPEQLRGYGWRQFLHPEDYAHVLSVRARSLETGDPYEVEYRFREGRTGAYRWFLTRGSPVRDETGQVVKWFGTCTDIDDQKRTEEALRQSQERVQALMASSIIGIVIADDDMLIEANDAFLHMTGYTQEDVQSGTLRGSTLFLPADSARHEQTFQEFAVFRQVKPYETVCVCKNGCSLPILIGIVALPYHPDHTIGFILDNAARKELEQRKDDFISMAGHELRTPLTSLKLQTQLLEKRLLKQDISHSASVLSRVEGQIKLLERLISELLDVSKIQAGRLEYVQETIDLDELLHEVAESMQQMSATHTIAVRGAEHLSLIGDRDRLGQVFTNLLSNAIKYSPAASVVEVDVEAFPERVRISVRDQGLGILPEQRAKIFERFYRVVASSQKGISGLGMGLYIVAEIVKQHGGTITVDSEAGKGSIFRVELPRLSPPDPLT